MYSMCVYSVVFLNRIDIANRLIVNSIKHQKALYSFINNDYLMQFPVLMFWATDLVTVYTGWQPQAGNPDELIIESLR